MNQMVLRTVKNVSKHLVSPGGKVTNFPVSDKVILTFYATDSETSLT